MRRIALGAALLLIGCKSDPNAIKGFHYFCDVKAMTGTLAKVHGGISLNDTKGHESWCAPLTGPPATVLCQQACKARVLGLPTTTGGISPVSCNNVVGEESPESEYVVWDSDLRVGVDKCTPGGGFVQGPGRHGQKPVITGGVMNDVFYTCLYVSSPALCDPFIAQQQPALGTQLSTPVNYRATLAPGLSAHVVSDEDASKNGKVPARAGDRSLSFNLDSSHLYLTNLFLPFQAFTFNDSTFDKGSVYLLQPVVAAATGPGTYSVPVGQAQFSVIAVDQDSLGYSIKASNTTPLIISLNRVDGPQVNGRVQGSLDGHAVHADFNGGLLWLNRPPVAKARVSNVVFNSSSWPDATDHEFRCVTAQGLRTVKWHGVEGARVLVTLDASQSDDPDADDELQFSWNMAPLGNQDIAYAYQGVGKHHALLAVQDQYFVSTVADVQYEVNDLAFKIPSDCGYRVKLFSPSDVIRQVDPGDPAPFSRAVILGYAQSEGTGVSLNAHTVQQVAAMASVGGEEFRERFLRHIQSPSFGVAPMLDVRFANRVRVTPVRAVVDKKKVH